MKKILAAYALLGAISLVGCGSGGGGGTALTATPAGTGRAAVLLTDGFREDFSHVWATIYHVELIPQTGANIVLYDNPAGIQIDLKTLRDSTGARFSFLGGATIPAGTYTAIKVTVGPTMQLFQNGAAVGSPLTVDATLPKDANGNPILTDTFKTPKTVTAGTTSNLVLDFNLAHFIVRGSNILPAVEDGDTAGTGDPSRHNPAEYDGTVSALTGTSPVLTFTLTEKNGSTVTVVTTASTALFGSTTLANGSLVEITGTLDTTTQNLVATQLEVRPANASPNIQIAAGTASALDAKAGTFILTVTNAHGFTPSSTTVNIVTNSSTVFHGDNGATLAQADFFTALGTTPTVAVNGVYDAASNTLTATGAMVVNHANDGGWEHDNHKFRQGVNAGNWGHGVFHDN